MSKNTSGISFTNPEVVKTLYKMGDKNNDGSIDENEFKTGLTEMGLPENLANAGWNIGDKNNDNKLSLEEAIDLGTKYGHIGDKHCQGKLNEIFGGGGVAAANAGGSILSGTVNYPALSLAS